jgi:flavin reductase (DIM6/NTAB) family NADH-FMN oxidoreductase RutF
MKHLDALDRTRCKYPQWVVFVTTRDAEGVPNTMPASMCAFVSHDPYLVAVAVSPKRHTHGLLAAAGRFVVSWAGAGQAELIRQTSRTSGRECRKFERFRIASAPGPQSGLPLIEGCAGHLECALQDRVTAGDHTVFIGRVLGVSVPDAPIAPLTRFGLDAYDVALPHGRLDTEGGGP